MSASERYVRDSLFDQGFALLNQGNYDKGIELLRVASGAEHLEAIPSDQKYNPASGISLHSQIGLAASGKGRFGPDGRYDTSAQPVDPAALVFMGAESEFKGFIERRTGESPDYRLTGYRNHLGEAIDYYRRAEQLRYPVATERLESLRLRLGSEDFRLAEQSFRDSGDRWDEHYSDRILGMLGSRLKPVTSTRVEVIGVQRPALDLNPTIKLFWDGRELGKIKPRQGHLEFEIQDDGELFFKSPWGSGSGGWPIAATGSPKVYFGLGWRTRALFLSDTEFSDRYLDGR